MKIGFIYFVTMPGNEFWFLNRNKEPFDWTDEVPDDGGEFQGLLGEEAPFPVSLLGARS